MNSLIGTWVLCSVGFTSYNPALKKEVYINATNIKCQVIDDQIMKVGSPGWWRSPIVVDCSKELGWLKPTNTDGIFTFMKEDKDCDYGEI